jgi:ATP-binding cassette, subfamily C (CFTR/MRP), member 1
LFGEELKEDKYNEIIEICQLARDLEILEGGDLTQIGEKGINLSGGQKARLSIARAVYANKDIVLMDDPLSALDAHVRKNIFDQVICDKLKNKTRILVTHAVDFLDRVDKILVIEKGKILHEGTFDEIKDQDYFKIIVQQQKEAEMREGLNQEDEKEEENSEERKYFEKKSRKSHLSKKGTTITADENKEIAKVDFRVYWDYFTFSPLTLILFMISILGLTIRRFSSMFFDYTLLKWVKSIAETKENDAELFWILIGSTFLTTIVAAISIIIMIWFSMSVSVKMFRKMLDKVCHAPINLYYDVTPSGVILNRFSKDINSLDTRLPNQIQSQISNYLVVISAIAVTAFNIVWVLAIVPFILIILIYLLKQYSKTLKEASRMESVTSSPVLTHLNETINGVSTIRAFDKVQEFEQKGYELLDRRVSAMIIKRGVQCWFNSRINLLSVFLMFFTYIY